MKHLIILISLIVAAPLHAQTIGDGIAEIGKMQITLDGQSHELSGLTFTDRNNSTVELSKIANFTTLIATAMTIVDGAPTSPVVTVVIGPFTNENFPAEASFEWYNGPEITAANDDTGMRVTLSDLVLGEDGTLSFGFEGQAIAAARADGTMVPIDGAVAVPVSGSYSGAIAQDN